MPTTLLPAPPDFQTYLQPCDLEIVIRQDFVKMQHCVVGPSACWLHIMMSSSLRFLLFTRRHQPLMVFFLGVDYNSQTHNLQPP